MSSLPAFDTAIVGAGIAGSVVAASLARNAPAEYRAVLFDAHDPGPGTAYRSQSDRLLMNGPVRAMSIVPGDKDHLARYASDAAPDNLIPRTRFARYARETLDLALARHHGVTFDRCEIVDLEPTAGGYVLFDAHGPRAFARDVVLALGNLPPGDAFVPDIIRNHAAYVANPWHFDARAHDTRRILLLGSGLTAMDVIAQLEERSFAGTVHLLSRHGLLPLLERPHVRGLEPQTLRLDFSSPRSLLRTMRSAAAAHVAAGGDWRAVAEAIRGASASTWQAWPLRERRRFLRHVQPFWSVHRYRIPAQTLAAFERLAKNACVLRHRGRLTRAALESNGTLAVEAMHAGKATHLRVDAVVNCTGPQGNYAVLAQPFIRNARLRGLLRPDALRLGIDADANYNVIDANGVSQAHLFTLGPPLRGLLYETTAIPEVRDQAGRIAGALVERYTSAVAEVAS